MEKPDAIKMMINKILPNLSFAISDGINVLLVWVNTSEDNNVSRIQHTISDVDTFKEAFDLWVEELSIENVDHVVISSNINSTEKNVISRSYL